jgi:hypothetical protein
MIVRVDGRRGEKPPPELFFAHQEWHRDCQVYAPFPINLALRAWQHRWFMMPWLVENGIVFVVPGYIWRTARLLPIACWFRGRVVRDMGSLMVRPW